MERSFPTTPAPLPGDDALGSERASPLGFLNGSSTAARGERGSVRAENGSEGRGPGHVATGKNGERSGERGVPRRRDGAPEAQARRWDEAAAARW